MEADAPLAVVGWPSYMRYFETIFALIIAAATEWIFGDWVSDDVYSMVVNDVDVGVDDHLFYFL